MNKSLVIVESPGKIKKIKHILGNDFVIMASVGHIIDLPPKTIGIDMITYKPTYEIYPDKKKVVSGLKKIIKTMKITNVFIASDDDREGEFIGYSLVKMLGLKKYQRITFNEITKNAIINALNNPRQLNNDLISAQQCRRIIDRLIGFTISPKLNKSINLPHTYNLGAGRVQSVIIKIIYDKQVERNKVLESITSSDCKDNLFDCTATFDIGKNKVNANLYLDLNYKNKMIELQCDKQQMILWFKFIKEILKDDCFTITKYQNDITINEIKHNPPYPYITSTLQQDAFTKYNFSIDKTMKLAQQLYEKGYITYMRTDSPHLSNVAIEQIKKYIIANYEPKYLHIRQYNAKNTNAQEAHEAIRPTDINVSIDSLENVDIDCKKLYDMIWKRTISSQMIAEVVGIIKLKIRFAQLNNDNNFYSKFIANLTEQICFLGSITQIIEPGYKIVYNEINNIDYFETLKNNLINAKIKMKTLQSTQIIKSIPQLYNQCSLIKILEKNGIGRPSTFASLLKKIIDYKYIYTSTINGISIDIPIISMNKNEIEITTKTKTIGNEKQKLVVSDIGEAVVNYICNHYPLIMDYKYTAEMENKLDLIANGKLNNKIVIDEIIEQLNC